MSMFVPTQLSPNKVGDSGIQREESRRRVGEGENVQIVHSFMLS